MNKSRLFLTVDILGSFNASKYIVPLFYAKRLTNNLFLCNLKLMKVST